MTGDKQINEPWLKKEVSSLFYKYEFGEVFTNNEKIRILTFITLQAVFAGSIDHWATDIWRNYIHLGIRNDGTEK